MKQQNPQSIAWILVAAVLYPICGAQLLSGRSQPCRTQSKDSRFKLRRHNTCRLRGKVGGPHFWASWCPPWLEETNRSITFATSIAAKGRRRVA